jgi:hypothetical protein
MYNLNFHIYVFENFEKKLNLYLNEKKYKKLTKLNRQQIFE